MGGGGGGGWGSRFMNAHVVDERDDINKLIDR